MTTLAPCPSLALLVVSICMTMPLGAADRIVYDDALTAGFQDWSWATVDLANTSPVGVGSLSIALEADGWAGLYFYSETALDVASWSGLRLWIHGGPSGGQLLRLNLQSGSSSVGSLTLDPAPAGAWEVRELDFSAAGLVVGTFDGIIIQDNSGADQPTVFLDQLELIENDEPPPPPTTVTVSIDPDADRRPIDPRIYGVNFGDDARIAEVGYPFRRWGGNSVTRFNWELDITNRAADWFFQNIPAGDPGTLPHGSSSDQFVDATLAAGAEPLLTVPAIGWAPVDERVKKWGFSVAGYGAQLVDECSFFGDNPPFWCTADSGDGTCDPTANTTGYCSSDGLIVGNDPTDTSKVVAPSYWTSWMSHIASRVGNGSEGGVRMWAIDNEPMLWDSTHRDVHPEPATYDELWQKTQALASAIKAQDPAALVFGPAVWGWCAYFSSAADAAYPNGICTDGPDRQAHGGLAFVPWYLEQVCAAETATGVRPVDYLDVHYYPQGGVAGLSGDGEDSATAARRLRSVRELWDPNWVAESWIGQPVELIPRLRGWIADHCPGLGLAITEYRWGSDDGPSSAVAHAEVLAVFGREGVDIATRWVAPDAGSKVEDAFEVFLDYDGSGAQILGDSVRASSSDVDALGAYAVRGDDDELWIVLINRSTSALHADVIVASRLGAGPVEVYGFDASNPLRSLATLDATRDGVQVPLPPRSVTLVAAGLESPAIFSDGFEDGITAWSETSQ